MYRNTHARRSASNPAERQRDDSSTVRSAPSCASRGRDRRTPTTTAA